MSVTLAQFRTSLGKHAEGLSDEEIQKRLDYAYRFSESFYEWFSERKGTGVEAISGAYISDVRADTVRSIERMRATRKDVHLLPQVDPELVKIAKQYEQRYS